MPKPKCDTCEKAATFYKRAGATMSHGCPEHSGVGWKSVDAMTYEIDVDAAKVKKGMALP